MQEIYPRHVAEYGAERLAADLQSEFAETTPTLGEKMREFGNDAYRRLVYKPLIRVRGRSMA